MIGHVPQGLWFHINQKPSLRRIAVTIFPIQHEQQVSPGNAFIGGVRRLKRPVFPAGINEPAKLHALKFNGTSIMLFKWITFRSKRFKCLNRLSDLPQLTIAKLVGYPAGDHHAAMRQVSEKLLIEFPNAQGPVRWLHGCR